MQSQHTGSLPLVKYCRESFIRLRESYFAIRITTRLNNNNPSCRHWAMTILARQHDCRTPVVGRPRYLPRHVAWWYSDADGSIFQVRPRATRS